MAITKPKLKQLENSTTVGSITSTDTSNILTYVAPAAQNHLWGYEHSTTATLPVLIGTNLSYDAGTNTLNASAGVGGYSDVLNSGTGFTNSNTNTKLNFLGSALTASDGGAGETDLTFAAILNTIATAGSVSLTGAVSGTLPVANGGTGATTLTGLLQGNGTSAVTAITNSSTVGQILRVTGASTYAWGALDLADTDAITGDLPFANLAQGTALSVLGVTGNSTADNASIAAGTDNQVLRRSGTSLAFGAVNLASSDAVTGVLDETNGGTGQSTITTGDILYGSGSNTLSKLSIGAASTYLKGGTTPSWATLNIAALSDGATIATQTYVNNLIAGLRKGSVRVATTVAGTLASSFENGDVIDGVTLATGDLILIKNQATQAENGVYTVNVSGAPTRATWMDAANEIDGVYVAVEDGTANVGTLWITVSEVTTLNTDAIVFTQIQTSGSIGGSIGTDQVAHGSGTNTIEGIATFLFDGTRLSINDASPAASTILNTKGTGTTSATFGLIHKNSSNTTVFTLADDGDMIIGGSTPLTITSSSISRGADISIQSTTATGSIQLQNTGATTTANRVIEINPGVDRNHTSGDHIDLTTETSLTVASGSGTLTGISIQNDINQTGTATGITRGVHIIPNLAGGVIDYRGLEITSSASHYALWSTAGKVRFDLGSDVQGDLLTRGSGGELVRIAAGATAGHVLTSNGAGAAPTYQAASGGTKTVGYVTGTGTATYDLDAGVVVLDIDGAAFAFTVPTDLDLVDVYRNGIMLSRSGTVGRDYTLNSGTGVLVLASVLATDESLKIVKRV